MKKLENIEDFEIFDYSRSKSATFLKYKSENYMIYIRGNQKDAYINIFAKTERSSEQAFKVFINYNEPSQGVECYFTSYFMNGNSLDSTSKTKKVKDYDYLSKKYYPYINTDVMFQQFFTGSENIMLLVGAPGIGKSKLSTLSIKYAFENPDMLPYDKLEENTGLEEQYISVGYIKSTDVLSNDKFWRMIEKAQYDIIIIDDLDYMLTKRDAEIQTGDDKIKNNFLNQFLSFTDGVEKNKTKFIITTNQSFKDIDSALLRKGRLFNILELRALTLSEALDIWKENELDVEDFNDLYANDSEVLGADLGSEISKRLNVRISTACDEYLAEPEISKLQSVKRSKSIHL
jgi:SpoVK/Ycf46/Vps4 family AAA+-type ATPase